MIKIVTLTSIVITLTCITHPIIAQDTFPDSDSVVYEYVYDTIYEYDTLFLETEITDTNTLQLIKENKKKNTEWCAGAHIAIGQSINQPTSGTIERSMFNEIRSNVLGYELSGFLKYKNNQWTASAGVGITCYRETIEAKPTNLVITENPYQQLDTISSYYTENSDGTTTWHYITRNNTYYTYDSTFENTPYVNHTFLLEIPLIVGRQLPFKEKTFNIEAGIIPGYYLKSKSNNIAVSSDGSLHYIDKRYFQSFQLAFFFAATIDIPLYDKIIFQPGLNLRYQATSLYVENYLYSYKPISLGVNCNFISLF